MLQLFGFAIDQFLNSFNFFFNFEVKKVEVVSRCCSSSFFFFGCGCRTLAAAVGADVVSYKLLRDMALEAQRIFVAKARHVMMEHRMLTTSCNTMQCSNKSNSCRFFQPKSIP